MARLFWSSASTCSNGYSSLSDVSALSLKTPNPALQLQAARSAMIYRQASSEKQVCVGIWRRIAPPTHTYSGPSASFSANLNSKLEDDCGCRRVCKPATQAITQLRNNLHLALSVDLASAYICPLNMEWRAVGWTVSYVKNRKHGANLRRILLFTCIFMPGHCN